MSNNLAHNYTPKDILMYVLENEKEMDFISRLNTCSRQYSICEIVDKVIAVEDGIYRLFSKQFDVNVVIDDAAVVDAVRGGKYVSAFISRHGDSFQAHFLVHPVLNAEKSYHEEEILMGVIQYMIFKTIIALRLDTYKKVDEFIERG